jgi:hypothetical protein
MFVKKFIFFETPQCAVFTAHNERHPVFLGPDPQHRIRTRNLKLLTILNSLLGTDPNRWTHSHLEKTHQYTAFRIGQANTFLDRIRNTGSTLGNS